MSLNFGITLLALVSLSDLGIAQSLQPITGPVRDAGTYHLATKTWTRNKAGDVALLGPNALYDNTCTVGYYTNPPFGTTLADSGRIPSTSDGGLFDTYEIQSFEFGYCSYFATAPLVLGLAYYDCYAACDGLATTTPVAAFSFANLPVGGAGGVGGCWIVTVDLKNTSRTFTLTGDCNTNFDNTPSTDSFGWSWSELVPSPGNDYGPLVAGDALGVFNSSCGVVGDSTHHPGPGSWGGAPTLGPAGTGIGIIDQFEFIGGGVTGCFWFGGYNSSASSNPISAFYHRLRGREDSSGGFQGSAYCDGSGVNCPGFASGAPGHGCPNTNANGLGARLVGQGPALLTNPNFSLGISDSAPNKPGLLIQGMNAINYPNGNAGLPDSAGLLCVLPQMRGFLFFVDGVGASVQSSFQGQPFSATAQPVGSTTFYQYWFRDPGNTSANPGAGAEFNFSNGVEVVWAP